MSRTDQVINELLDDDVEGLDDIDWKEIELVKLPILLHSAGFTQVAPKFWSYPQNQRMTVEVGEMSENAWEGRMVFKSIGNVNEFTGTEKEMCQWLEMLDYFPEGHFTTWNKFAAAARGETIRENDETESDFRETELNLTLVVEDLLKRAQFTLKGDHHWTRTTTASKDTCTLDMQKLPEDRWQATFNFYGIKPQIVKQEWSASEAIHWIKDIFRLTESDEDDSDDFKDILPENFKEALAQAGFTFNGDFWYRNLHGGTDLIFMETPNQPNHWRYIESKPDGMSVSHYYSDEEVTAKLVSLKLTESEEEIEDWREVEEDTVEAQLYNAGYTKHILPETWSKVSPYTQIVYSFKRVADAGWRLIYFNIRYGTTEHTTYMNDEEVREFLQRTSDIRENIKPQERVTLEQLFLDNEPEEYVRDMFSQTDLKVPYLIHEVDPATLTLNGTPLPNLVKVAKSTATWKIVQMYKIDPGDPVILNGNAVLDGHHRAMAAFLSKRMVKAINVEDQPVVESEDEDNFDMKDVEFDGTVQRWVFTDRELKNPENCLRHDQFLASCANEVGDDFHDDVIVYRNGEVTDTWFRHDGFGTDGQTIKGVPPEIQKQLEDVEVLRTIHPKDYNDHYARNWTNVYVDEKGNFRGFVTPPKIRESDDDSVDWRDVSPDDQDRCDYMISSGGWQRSDGQTVSFFRHHKRYSQWLRQVEYMSKKQAQVPFSKQFWTIYDNNRSRLQDYHDIQGHDGFMLECLLTADAKWNKIVKKPKIRESEDEEDFKDLQPSEDDEEGIVKELLAQGNWKMEQVSGGPHPVVRYHRTLRGYKQSIERMYRLFPEKDGDLPMTHQRWELYDNRNDGDSPNFGLGGGGRLLPLIRLAAHFWNKRLKGQSIRESDENDDIIDWKEIAPDAESFMEMAGFSKAPTYSDRAKEWVMTRGDRKFTVRRMNRNPDQWCVKEDRTGEEKQHLHITSNELIAILKSSGYIP